MIRAKAWTLASYKSQITKCWRMRKGKRTFARRLTIKPNNMEKQQTKVDNIALTMVTEGSEPPDKRIIRGRGFLQAEESRFLFVQNEKKYVKSVEVGRTRHSRLIRRVDGSYVVTFRFDAKAKYIKSDLQAEVRDIVDAAIEDEKKVKLIDKTEEK